MSRSHGGSRYPSAYGHTPSYRSYNALGSGGVSSSLDTSLPSSSFSSSLRSSDLTRDKMFSDADKFFDTSLDRTFDKYDLGLPSTTSGGSSSTSAASKKVKTYSSSYQSSSADGGKPHVQYSTDQSFRSTATGPSGIPHSSYSHSSSNYDSDRPYANRLNNYSYNI